MTLAAGKNEFQAETQKCFICEKLGQGFKRIAAIPKSDNFLRN